MMKSLRWIICLLSCVALADPPPSPYPVVNVRDYGAVGDGVTRDELAFQRAINRASGFPGGEVLVPPGTYLLGSQESHPDYDVSVFIYAAAGTSIRVRGEPGATLLFTNSYRNDGTIMFYITGPANLIEFDGIHFIAKHEPDPASPIIALMQGWDFGGIVTNMVVKNCSFRDFGSCVSCNCVDTFVSTHNRFRYSRGRNEMTQNGGVPACAVNVMFCRTVESSFNDFVGSDIDDYRGVTNLAFLGPMDGYFNGSAARSTFVGDRIRRNGFEGIMLHGRWWPDDMPAVEGGGLSGYVHLGQHVISDCIIDGDIAPGQSYLPWSGISILDSGSTVQGCRIYDCKTGVYSQWEYPKPSGIGLTSLRVANNDIRMPSVLLHHSQYTASGGAFDQGVLVVGWKDVSIIGNRVTWPDRWQPPSASPGYLSGVALYGTTNVTVMGNEVVFDQPSTNSPTWIGTGVSILGGVQDQVVQGNCYVNPDKGEVNTQPQQPMKVPLPLINPNKTRL